MSEIHISKGDVPELDGVEGDVKVQVEGHLTWNGDEGTITADMVNVDTENQADKAFKEMRGEPHSQENMPKGDMEGGSF